LPEEIQAGTRYNFERRPGLRDDGGWLGLRGGSFRPTPHPRNNTLHRSRRAGARLFDRQLTRGGPVNVSVLSFFDKGESMLRFTFQLLALTISVLSGSFANCQNVTATIEDPDFVSSDSPQELSNYLANLSGIAAMNSGASTGFSLLSADDPAVTIYVPVVLPGGGVVIIPIWIVTPVVTDKFPDTWPVEPNKKKIGYR
jgi:hypothetical protein